MRGGWRVRGSATGEQDKHKPALRVLISRDAKARAQHRSEAAADAFAAAAAGGGLRAAALVEAAAFVEAGSTRVHALQYRVMVLPRGVAYYRIPVLIKPGSYGVLCDVGRAALPCPACTLSIL